MPFDDEPDDASPTPAGSGLPLTINQVVAYNIRRARLARDMRQSDVATAMAYLTSSPWSAASVSAAEKSFDGGRRRHFTANDIAAFSKVFELPIAYFFLPPERPLNTSAGLFTAGIDDSKTAEGKGPYFMPLWEPMYLEQVEPSEPAHLYIERVIALKALYRKNWKPATTTYEYPVPAHWVPVLNEWAARLQGRKPTPVEIGDWVSELNRMDEWNARITEQPDWRFRFPVIVHDDADPDRGPDGLSARVIHQYDLPAPFPGPHVGDVLHLADGARVRVVGTLTEDTEDALVRHVWVLPAE